MRREKESAWSEAERALWEETVIMSPNSVDLMRTVKSDYLHRFSEHTQYVAELFQENSKLTRCSTLEVPPDHRKLEEVREWYFNTAYAIKEEDLDSTQAHHVRMPIEELTEALASLLEVFSQPGCVTNSLYALDLFLLHSGRLFRIVPQSSYLWVERDYQAEEVQRLKREIIDVSRDMLAHASNFLFVVGVAWRYMMVYGPRGYRHTLMDAGRLLAHLEARASQVGIRMEASQNFYDNRVDRFLFMDGVERSTLAVIALQEGQL